MTATATCWMLYREVSLRSPPQRPCMCVDRLRCASRVTGEGAISPVLAGLVIGWPGPSADVSLLALAWHGYRWRRPASGPAEVHSYAADSGQVRFRVGFRHSSRPQRLIPAGPATPAK